MEEDGVFTPVEGVTDTCHIIDASVRLIPWAAKMTAEKLIRTMPKFSDELGEFSESLPWLDFVRIVNEAKSAHKEKLEDAGDVGGAAHLWLQDSIQYAIDNTDGIVLELDYREPTDERAKNCGLAAFNWMKKHSVQWIATEMVVFSRKYRYAGTTDGLAFVDSCDELKCCPVKFHHELSVIDWKSSNYLKTEYLYQTASYLNCILEQFGE